MTIARPDRLQGPAVDGGSLVKGLLLRTGERAVVLDTGALPQALGKASLPPAAPFTLEGYFDVPAEDLYQFQLRFPGQATLEVDSVRLDLSGGQMWSFVPVQLAGGTHRLKATFEPQGAAADLDLRFGNQGAQTLSVERFRCSAASPAAALAR